MSAAEKYTVRLRGEQADITHPARRRDAHNLVKRLGCRYVVWNKITRQESTN